MRFHAIRRNDINDSSYKMHAPLMARKLNSKQNPLKQELTHPDKAMLLHNPGAGDGDTSRAELLKLLRAAGFKCSYSSTKPLHWEKVETAAVDLLVLAGGDGTVRKIAGELLDRKVLDRKLPIGLLPFGTANNIARTLDLPASAAEIIRGWRTGKIRHFDVGRIDGLSEPTFFLESFGYGLFPKLMHEMKVQKKDAIEDPAERLDAALHLLYELILSSPAKKCRLSIDDKDHSGNFLLIEVMNIRSIGPNLNLAPEADPGDGEFDVVLISEDQRPELAEYVRKKIDGREVTFEFPVLRAQAIEMFWDGRHLHVDDEYQKLKKPARINIELRPGLLDFLVPR
jgi:diacylglycerol kinase family enzyme